MKIDLKRITVRDLVAGYSDDGEGGVRGYGGRASTSDRLFSGSSSTRTSSGTR